MRCGAIEAAAAASELGVGASVVTNLRDYYYRMMPGGGKPQAESSKAWRARLPIIPSPRPPREQNTNSPEQFDPIRKASIK